MLITGMIISNKEILLEKIEMILKLELHTSHLNNKGSKVTVSPVFV
jgi:hypothetical protein